MEGKTTTDRTDRMIRLPELPAGARDVHVSEGNPPRCRSYRLDGGCCRENQAEMARAAAANLEAGQRSLEQVKAERDARGSGPAGSDIGGGELLVSERERDALVAPFQGPPGPPGSPGSPGSSGSSRSPVNWSPMPRVLLRPVVVGIALFVFTVAVLGFGLAVLCYYWACGWDGGGGYGR